MINKKCIICALLCLLLTAVLVTGCRSGNDDTPAAGSATPTTAPAQSGTDDTGSGSTDTVADTGSEDSAGEEETTPPPPPPSDGYQVSFPLTDSPVTFTVYSGRANNNEDYFENEYTKWLEETTGVNIEWIDYGETMAFDLMMASGRTLPDIIFRGLGDGPAAQWGAAGAFIPLNDLIEEYGVYTKQAFAMYENQFDVYGRITSPDGNIYGLPAFNDAVHPMVNEKAWINQAWLDNLNLSVPTTTEEFYNTLVAFRDQDPTGTGVETLPFAAFRNGDPFPENFLISPFVQTAGRNSTGMFYVDAASNSNALEFVPMTEGWREGLRYYKRLFDEGLLGTEVFNVVDNNIVVILRENMPNAGGFISAGPTGGLAHGEFDNQMDFFTWVPPLKGPDGFSSTWHNPYATLRAHQVFITSSCNDPVLAFKWLDFGYDEMNSVYRTTGFEGVGWRAAEPGELDFFGGPARWAYIIPYGTPSAHCWYNIGAYNITYDWRYSEAVSNSAGVSDQLQLSNIALVNASLEYLNHVPSRALRPFVMTGPESEYIQERTWSPEGMVVFYRDAVANFVTGEWDIETGWDAYLEELNRRGLQDYVKFYNDVYQAQYGRTN